MEFAFFGPTEKHYSARGGFCISVFALAEADGEFLVVKPSDASKWKEEWMPNWRVYEPAALQADSSKWRLPSSYVGIGEHPRVTLERVMRDQLGVPSFEVEASSLESFYGPSRRYQGEMHWDYCFAFRVAGKVEPSSEWVADWAYVPPAELKGEMGSNQWDLVERLLQQETSGSSDDYT